jgi:hypothetical protein
MKFQRLAIVGAICWTVIAGYLLFDVGGYVQVSTALTIKEFSAATNRTFQFDLGRRSFLAIAFPVVLAAAPLFANASRRFVLLISGTLLLIFSILGAAAGAALYMPAALLLLVAAIAWRSKTSAA